MLSAESHMSYSVTIILTVTFIVIIETRGAHCENTAHVIDKTLLSNVYNIITVTRDEKLSKLCAERNWCR